MTQEAPSEIRVADPDHFNADPDPAFHFAAGTDPVFHQSDGDLRSLVYITFLKSNINFLIYCIPRDNS